MPLSELKINRSYHEDVVILKLTGGLSAQTSKILISEVELIGDILIRKVQVDLEDLYYIDSAGIAALLTCHRNLHARNIELRLTLVPPSIMRSLTVCNIDSLIPIGVYEGPHTEKIRQQQQALLHSYEYTEQLLSSLGEGVIAIDPEGNVLFMNPSAELILKTQEEQILGKPLTAASLIQIEESDIDFPHLIQLLARGEKNRFHGEVVINLPGNEKRYYMVNATHIRRGEQPSGAIIGLIDITPRHETEEALRKAYERIEEKIRERTAELEATNQRLQEEIRERINTEKNLLQTQNLYQGLLNSEEDLVVRLDSKGRFTYVNDKVLKKFNVKPEELIGFSFTPLVHPEDLSRSWEGIQAAFHPPYRSLVEQRVSSPDGWWWMRCENSAVFNEKGEVVEVQSIGRDITHEKFISRDRRILSAALESSPDGIGVIDLNGRIEYVNPAFETLSGLTFTELKGADLSFFRFFSFGQEEVSISELLKRKDNWKGRLTCRGNNRGEIHLEGILFPVTMEEGKIENFLIVVNDITHEAELEASLRQSQKLEAIGTLASGIAHDFNNILSAIIGFAEMAQEEISPDHSSYDYIQEVLRGALRGRELIRQILTFTRSGQEELKPIQPSVIVKESLHLLRATLPSSIYMRWEITPDCHHILADPTQIHQIMMNLCSNAAYAMRESGGVLTILVENCEVDTEFARYHPSLTKGTYVRLTVSDTGTGMDSQTLDRIFEPFFTTKPSGEGTGMGLSMVHGIITKAGGGITVSSELGVGTTFRVYFPIIKEDTELGSIPGTLPEKYSLGHGERILLVDDEEYVVGMLKKMLDGLGYQVTEFTDSLKALKAFILDPMAFDFVITDQTMPNLQGADLAKEILWIRPDIPVVLITGYSESLSPSQAQKIGISGFLLKPVTKDEVGRMLSQLLIEKRTK